MYVDGFQNGRRAGWWQEIECRVCAATGYVTVERAALIAERKAIRKERVRRGESQAEAAVRMGKTVQEYSRWEHGE